MVHRKPRVGDDPGTSRPGAVVAFEATIGHFVSTRDGNILISLLSPGREAGEVAKLVTMFGYRLKVTMEVERLAFDAV